MPRFVYCISSILIILLIGCYNSKEACLDTLATNYDVTADDSCDACCTYPTLTIRISHMAGDTIFSTQEVYTNDFGQKYQLLDIRFYVSSFYLYESDRINQKSTILTKISNTENSVIIPDDMKIIRIADNTINVGSVKTYGKMDSLTFDVGLNSVITNNQFSDLPAAHVLQNANKLKSRDNNLVFATMKYIKMEPVKDTIELAFSDAGFLKKVTIDSIITTAKGENFNYSIKADYLRLLKNVNLDSSNSFIEKTVNKNFGSIIVVK